MEPFIADIINDESVPKIIRYSVVSVIEILLAVLVTIIAIKCEAISEKVVCVLILVFILALYVALMIKIHGRKK